MKATFQFACSSLIVYSTLWASVTHAQEGESEVVADSGRAVLRSPGLDLDTAGRAAPVPFGPMIDTFGVWGQGRGWGTDYYGARAFIPKHIVPAESLLFLSLSGAVDEEGKAIGNYGLGYSQYVRSLNRVLSASGWFDFDDGHSDTFFQAGINLASRGKYLDFNFNGYMIVGEDNSKIFEGFLGPAFFQNNALILNHTEVSENAYSGFDMELGGPLPYIGRYGVSAYAGGYYMNSREGQSTAGARVRVQGRISDDAVVGVEYTSDSLFGDNAYVNVALSFPPGRRHRWFRQRPVRERLADRTVRNERIATDFAADRREFQALNPRDGQPFSIIHVDPNRGAGGSGTFEDPFGRLELGRLANNAAVDIIRVIPRTDGTGTNLAVTSQLSLFAGQRLLASSREHLVTVIGGVFELPGFTGFGPGPLISNSSTVASSVVQLNGSGEVNGFIIDGRDALGTAIHTGILGVGTDGFVIANNTFQNVVEGAVITNDGSGVGLVLNNTFNGNGHGSNRAFALNNTAGATLGLLVQGNTVTNHLGEDLDFDGLLDPGEDVNPTNAALDPGTAFEIIASGGSTINADAASGFGIINNSASDNGTGIVLTAQTGSTINATVQNNTLNNNADPNGSAVITADASTINLFSFANSQVNNSGGDGLQVIAQNGGTVNSVASEDLNNNGFLDAGEDANGNGVLDLGVTGNTMTGNADSGISALANNGTITNLHIGAADNTLPDDTVIGTVGTPDNVLTGNNVGITLSATNAGTLTGGIVNNDLEGNLQDGIVLDAQSGGSITLVGIQNNNLTNNPDSGLSLTGTGGTIAMGNVENNDFDRETTGQNGIFFNTTGVNISGTVSNNSFVAVPPLNPNASLGIGGTVTDGSLNLIIGGTTPAEGNLFDRNGDAAVGIILGGTATGTIDITQNTITRTTDGPNPDFDGDGIHIGLTGTAQLTSSTIDRNTIGSTDPLFGNANHGIFVSATDSATLVQMTIGNADGDNNNGNLISGNGLDGVHFERFVNGHIQDVRILDNTITVNGDDGIDLLAANANLTDSYDIFDNTITNNTDVGVDLRVIANADLDVDMGNNIVAFSGSHGVLITEQVNTASDSRSVTGVWTGNTFSNNGGHGINIAGATSGLVIGTAASNGVIESPPVVGNVIESNALDGVNITGAGSLTLGDNSISNNGTGGVDFDPATSNTLNLFDNAIVSNNGDGLEIRNNSGPFSVTVTGTGNRINMNANRGVDILNQGFNANTTITLNDNDISGNSEEGVYVVNTASTTQDQVGPAPTGPDDNTDPTHGMNADGSVFADPRLVFNFDGNNVDGNGVGSSFAGTGLVFRVGTADASGSFTDPGGFAATRAGIVASVTNNTMAGNLGVDFYVESFVSTVDPATTGGTWNATTFTVNPGYETDPLARMDLTYINNTIDESDANNRGSFYNNAETDFKSRDTAQTDPGPFAVGGTRRRNAQRLADRDVDIGGTLLPPATPGGASDTYLYPGMGQSTFRISAGSDTVPFILDNSPYVDFLDANGATYTNATVFGELPFGWGQF